MKQRIRKQRRARRSFEQTEGVTTEANGQMPFQASAEEVRIYGAIVNAITATTLNAQAGLDWLSVQSPNLEEVRRSLNSIASDAIRAGEAVVRLRALRSLFDPATAADRERYDRSGQHRHCTGL